MTTSSDSWRAAIAAALNLYRLEKGLDIPEFSAGGIIFEVPPKPELGDYAFPMFPYAKAFRSAPPAVASAVKSLIDSRALASGLGTVEASGPYLNVRIEKLSVVASTLKSVAEAGDAWGRGTVLQGQRIMVEFSGPNTNKPLHLGHLRNDALGESISRILAAAGGEVRKVNIINNRGIHICKSMLAYMKFGEGKTPESEGVKGDHFVGDYYVKFHTYAQGNPAAEAEAQELMRKWEAGDPATIDLRQIAPRALAPEVRARLADGPTSASSCRPSARTT